MAIIHGDMYSCNLQHRQVSLAQGMLLSREVHRHIYVVHVRSRTEFTSAPYIGLESVKEWQVHLQRVSEGLYANPAISRTNNTAGPYIAHT